LTARLLAATKFLVPVLPSRYVPRPRLHAALDAAAQLPLTVVVGVPGAGKSVMLESWLHVLLGLQYGEPIDIERAFSGYRRQRDLPDEELVDFVPGIWRGAGSGSAT